MATFRFQAIDQLLNRNPELITLSEEKISTYFGKDVFGFTAMSEFLTKGAYKAVKESMDTGKSIDRNVADEIASGMKAWAMSKGCTHYTHWFQPLTGTTAEKHDSFFEPQHDGSNIETFSGSLLVQQEPDASSFPNGGIRNTFEARGYTAWDPSSPAFIMDNTLCIPTIFISYTGESLDNKMPLLKALHAVDQSATAVAQYFDKTVTKTTATLGWEQEYFLVDTALFNARPDLSIAGRALVGHLPAKGQQLDDHYFGIIPERVTAFMKDFEMQSLRLGIPVRTRHNEVAPNQFECAPMFEECNLANDHNLLLMTLLEKIGRKHHFRVMMHEKPFAGLNGSGKHNNWSLSTDKGVNLLAPGNTPKSNLQFLTFLVNTIKAIHDNSDMLRASIASASNDHRLGANEAPPAIISVFIGSKLTEVLNEIENNANIGQLSPEDKTELKLNIGKIPQLLLDNTDRNRTSPFAFTGNKFEFRAVGSSANCAESMIALNTIIANQLISFKKNVDARIVSGVKKDDAIFQELKELIIDSKKIRFEGNGYGEEWTIEAEKRGLSNLKDTPRALQVYAAKSTEKIYSDLNIFNPIELAARHDIELEKYHMKIQIEGRILNEMVKSMIIPTAVKYQNSLIQNITGMQAVFGADSKVLNGQKELLSTVNEHLSQLYILSEEMVNARRKANKLESGEEKAFAYCDNVKPYFEKIKYHSDKLEILVDDELWPLPKLREILYTK
jgi:glutamine synthetase